MTLFLSGVGATLGLLLMLGAGFMLGKKNTPKAMTRPPTAEDEERAERMKAIQGDLIKMLQYDEKQAYAKKKVF